MSPPVVVKVLVKLRPKPFPATSFAPVVTVNRYVVPVARFAEGWKRTTLLRWNDITPATGEPPPDGASVTVDVLIVLRFIASLNLKIIPAFVATPVAPFTGDIIVTVGGVTSPPAAVVKVELNGVNPLLARSLAPLVTLTV